MRCRMQVLLAISLCLLMPLPVSAQSFGAVPSPKIEGSKWHILGLHQPLAPGLLKSLRWDEPKSSAFSLGADGASLNHNLPAGVRRVLASSDKKSLLIDSTETGFYRVQYVVGWYVFATRKTTPTVTYLSVSVTDAGLNWLDPPTSQLEIITGPATARVFERLAQSDHKGTTVQAANTLQTLEPLWDLNFGGGLGWTLLGYYLEPRPHADDTLDLIISYHHSRFEKLLEHLRQGDVLAVRERNQPTVTLIRIDT